MGPENKMGSSELHGELRKPSYKLTSTQIGALGENITASQIVLLSSGRICPCEPFSDDDGTDRLLYDKKTRLPLILQVKARLADEGEGDLPQTTQFDIRTKTFVCHKSAFILAVLLGKRYGNVLRCWLIPSESLHEISSLREEKYIIRPSPKDNSQDRYAKYRCHSMEILTNKLIEYFDNEFELRNNEI